MSSSIDESVVLAYFTGNALQALLTRGIMTATDSDYADMALNLGITMTIKFGEELAIRAKR